MTIRLVIGRPQIVLRPIIVCFQQRVVPTKSISLKQESASRVGSQGLKATMNSFLRNGKGMLLAYDQGFEHGPSADFNDKTIDPAYIMDIAEKGDFTGV